MKKSIGWMLVLALTLALCGCGEAELTDRQQKKIDLYEKYEDLIDRLEDEDYEGAYAELDSITGDEDGKDGNESSNEGGKDEHENSDEGGSVNGGEDTEGGEQQGGSDSAKPDDSEGRPEENPSSSDGPAVEQPEDESKEESKEEPESGVTDTEREEEERKQRFAESLVGEWLTAGDGWESVHLYPDGTCAVQGQSYTWRVNDLHNNTCYAEVMNGEEQVYNLQIQIEEDGRYNGCILLMENAAKTSTCYLVAQYETVEITMDNFYEYFEYKEEIVEQKNAFGELTRVVSNRGFVLREDYKERLNVLLSEAAIEYKYTSYAKDDGQYISDGQQFVWGETSLMYESSEVASLSTAYALAGSPYGMAVRGSSFGIGEKSSIWIEIGELLRVKGTLFLYKG